METRALEEIGSYGFSSSTLLPRKIHTVKRHKLQRNAERGQQLEDARDSQCLGVLLSIDLLYSGPNCRFDERKWQMIAFAVVNCFLSFSDPNPRSTHVPQREWDKKHKEGVRRRRTLTQIGD